MVLPTCVLTLVRPSAASNILRTKTHTGGALVPWVYSIVILLIHIPVVIIRVVKWESVQTWCLGATVFTIGVTALAFASTKFRSDKILTWTPLLLVIDAGSMAQVLFLIAEDYELLTRLKHAIMPARAKPSEEPFLNDKEAGKSGDPDELVSITTRTVDPTASTNAELSPLDTKQLLKEAQNQGTRYEVYVSSLEGEIQSWRSGETVPEGKWAPPLAAPNVSNHPPLFTSKPLYIAFVSALLLISIFALQFLGLHHAVNAAKQPAPSVSWCSPIFQPFGVAVLDGNCNVWPVLQTFTKGVGCILIPGHQQMAWLEATVAGTGLSIALELVDIGILATVHGSARIRGVKMRRPWFTMFSGVAVLGLVLVFGVVYGTILPPGISEKVWVVTDAGTVTVYEGTLGTAGLRGAMIGWNDGVFQGWGPTYFGSWAV